MADNTLAENVAQAIADFGEIRGKINEYIDVPSGTATADYAEKIDDIITECGKLITLPTALPTNNLKKIPFAFNSTGWANVNVPFRNSPNVTEIELDLPNVIYLYQLINGSKARKLTIRNMSSSGKACTMNMTFFQSGGETQATLEEIYGFNPTYASAFDNTFRWAAKLKILELCGTIKINGFDVSMSPLLTHESLVGIIDALEDKSEDTSGTAWAVTLGATNKAKLTAEELATATDKGWTVE